MRLPEKVHRSALGANLSCLDELIGDARVVAIGENNHHIREFTRLRERILRWLVTERGFSVLAFESGFAEGQLVDNWIRGGRGDLDSIARDGFTFRFGDSPEMRDMLTWLRAHNAAGGEVRFVGVDIPASGGSGLPALLRVRNYLAEHAPENLSLVHTAMNAVRGYAAANNSVAAARHTALSIPERDAATAALTRVLLRMDALPPGTDHRAHRIARQHALGALRVDEHLRELAALGAPDPPETLPSSRDVYQAETVRMLRELAGPDTRIVLMLHNGHIQREPMRLVPGVQMPSAGGYLSTELGSDYAVLGITARDGDTTDARLSDQAQQGFEVVTRPVEAPIADSVEYAVSETVSTDEPVLLDLRPARGSAGPSSIRHAYTHTPVDVLAAFDGLVCLPTMSPSANARAEH